MKESSIVRKVLSITLLVFSVVLLQGGAKNTNLITVLISVSAGIIAADLKED